MRRHLFVCFLIASPLLILARADVPEKAVADFTVKDIAGRSLSLCGLKDKKAVVVLFLGTQCPVNQRFMPLLVELYKEFAGRGVGFVAIYSNRQDSLDMVAEHAKKHEVPFPVVKDEGNVLADRFRARRTPEAFVLDGARKVRYQGRIDDRHGIDYQRATPRRRDLAEALGDVLAGKNVSVPETVAAGCIIGRVTKAQEAGAVTYTKQVARILQKHCQECHRPGQIGPMSLTGYEDAVAWGEMIREVISESRMPPWYADPRHGKWRNDRRLPKEDRDTLLAWLDLGTPRGVLEDLPPSRKFPEGWGIGKPDVIIPMPVEFDVPAETPKGGIPYKHYSVQTNFDEDKWIQSAEARPGAPEVVHHILVFIIPPGLKFIPGSAETPVLCGMAPGEQPLILPPGMAKHLPKGSRLIFQVHYTPNGKAFKDRSTIGLVFAKEPPAQRVITQPVFNLFFSIPPGADNHQVESSYTFKEDGYIIGYMPHMHLRGKDFLFEATYPDKRRETLLYVPCFNFNWQGIYRPVELQTMPKGTRIRCVAHFDNSKNNLNNPDPTVAVRWGDQTWQEMMVGWIDFAFDNK
jgi:peroxiredoxin/mono/diheme cytochrome c family protein